MRRPPCRRYPPRDGYRDNRSRRQKRSRSRDRSRTRDSSRSRDQSRSRDNLRSRDRSKSRDSSRSRDGSTSIDSSKTYSSTSDSDSGNDAMKKIFIENDKDNKYLKFDVSKVKHEKPSPEEEVRDDYTTATSAKRTSDKFIDRKTFDGKWAEKKEDVDWDNEQYGGGKNVNSETSIKEMEKILSKVKKEKKEKTIEKKRSYIEE